MNIFKRRSKAVVEISPIERVYNAVDELNAALNALTPEHGRLRPWVRSGNRTLQYGPKVMLGYWDAGQDRFVVTYGED